jgi:hypothetical protein
MHGPGGHAHGHHRQSISCVPCTVSSIIDVQLFDVLPVAATPYTTRAHTRWCWWCAVGGADPDPSPSPCGSGFLWPIATPQFTTYTKSDAIKLLKEDVGDDLSDDDYYLSVKIVSAEPEEYCSLEPHRRAQWLVREKEARASG